MTGEHGGDAPGALRTAYTDLAGIAVDLDEATSWRPTRLPGWAVRDLVFHLLADAQRALVALAGAAAGDVEGADGPDRDAVTRDAVSYWTDSPTGRDPESRGLRATRTMASAWRLDFLTGTYAETASAVLALAERTPGDALVATQGRVLRVDDLMVTLVVEAAVHHLDLVVHLDRPGPAPGPLREVRRTLDGLLGRPVPVAWDDVTYALAGTGRRALDDAERAALGPDADRLPLLS